MLSTQSSPIEPSVALMAIEVERERRRRRKASTTQVFRGGPYVAQAITDHEWILEGPAECVAGETLIYNPTTGISRQIRDLAVEGLPTTVLTIAGPELIPAPFRKGFAPLYRVTLATGASVVATSRHRLLTERGWVFVGDVVPGDLVPSSRPIPPGSTVGVVPPVSPQGGQHSTRKAQDSLLDCSPGLRPCDESLPPLRESDQVSFPSQADVAGRILPSDSQHYAVRRDKVASVIYLRDDDYFDMTVPVAGHYFAQGIWHHNTGKTFAWCFRLDTEMRAHPGAFAALVRKVRADMGSSILRTWERVIALRGGWRKIGGQNVTAYEHFNGARAIVAGLDRDSKVLSAEFDYIGACQIEELDLGSWEFLTMRTTGRGAVTQTPMVFGDCNPGPPNHWILQRESLRKLRSTHTDNPTLFNEDGTPTRQWTERTFPVLDALSGVRRERYLKGLWVAAEGVVYEDFSRQVHVLDAATRPDLFDENGRPSIPSQWRRVRVVDFGYTNPFVCLWAAMDYDGRLYVYREIYKTRRLVKDHAADIQRLSKGEDIEVTVVDHDAEDRATLEDARISTVPAWKPIERGIQAMKDRVRLAGDGKPRLFLMAGALVERDEELAFAHKPTSTVEEFENYLYPKSDDGRPIKEIPLKKDDHGMDALRYLVAYLDIDPDNRPVRISRDSIAVSHPEFSWGDAS